MNWFTYWMTKLIFEKNGDWMNGEKAGEWIEIQFSQLGEISKNGTDWMGELVDWLSGWSERDEWLNGTFLWKK